MDNKKIGKLIADLRKKQGLTQQELGDKVGVGFRAVSKWERGITLPDITIINEVSRILGISSDELLAGELKEKEEEIHEIENHKKISISSKAKVIILVITSIILIVSSIFIYQNNRTYVYDIESTSDEYFVEGQTTFSNNKMSIIINEINFIDEKFLSTIIKNYEYEITTDNDFIFGYGYNFSVSNIDREISIGDFLKTFQVNYNEQTEMKRTKILKNGITITIKFLDTNNKEITKDIKVKLYELDKKIKNA